ncbi:MAG TPA: phospho-sugar mutase [Rectinemataceae bacterium]|nr:phospho-sugar mutase [Rectinemataceae bacterium]
MEKTALLQRARDYLKQEKDPQFVSEVKAILDRNDEKELEDRFYRDLEFGTGGLRGIIGGGYNRMNTFVVTRATQGLCDYLVSQFPGKKLSACIAYDSRRWSADFGLATALVFAANGIKAYLFPSLRPTPELSFAVRRLGSDTGVVVTASHNPPQYNGYKAYWNDGSQVVPPHDVGIIDRVQKVQEAKTMTKELALSKGLLVMLDSTMDEAYIAMVKSRLLRPELIRKQAGAVKIVYTPLHGTGAMLFERIMGDLGLGVSTVPEQREPNGEFPTVSYPNPEEPAALKMAIDLGKRQKADVVMATDPDADRLGIAVPDKNGNFVLVTGNQLGALHLDYILSSLSELGRMPPRPVCIKSIVTTDFQAAIAKKYNVECRECLTGFKWIAEIMRQLEQEGKDFVYGTEESYGHLIETEVRDKDGISAAAITAEMTLFWRSKGKSLLDRLDELYREFGYYEEKGINKYFEGPTGMDIMKGIMDSYRKSQPIALGAIPVTSIRDVKNGVEWDTGSTDSRRIDLPESDVLQWRLRDGTQVTVRPSGTEPKIKYYILCRTEIGPSGLDAARLQTKDKISAIEADIRKIIG